MMQRFFALLGCLLLVQGGLAQQKPAYRIFDAKGRKVSYGKMVGQLAQRDIVLFGEYHNNPIIHWLQLITTRDLGQQRSIILGAEMFEADNQEGLTRYVEGTTDAKTFGDEVRLWNNHKTDYEPLVRYAREQKRPFIATNIPRRYASLVARGGFEALDTLPASVKAWIAPLPIPYVDTLPGYRNMLTMMGSHASPNLPRAQAIKDATMAHFILRHYTPGSLFLHFNGTYHSDGYEGILWYLKQTNPALRYATIATVTQNDLGKLLPDHRGRADFIICVDANMTTTY
ncbi:MAG TPA: ChaN family lipoprotein [Lacibacter sp.]|nr:ChaN family lipoprotein [Lacibacter sp.]HMO87544.1 ChaN family lipoprotein [Lacibacter sp.]HMP87774.1 ChaN family lipoprotein [Lacibacter sp.]